MNVITTVGFVFAALAWLWLAIRYFGTGDTIGGIIFLITAVISCVLFFRSISAKE
jgi:hypothetical protein